MSQIEIKHLRMLKMINTTGNLTQAARNLFVTQSALSQQLKEIEKRLGADLFYRTNRKMILTSVGKTLLEHGETILYQLEQAELDIDKAVNGEKGELIIGVRCLFCYLWLPKVLKKFQDKFPNVDVVISNSVEPETDLINENIDIAISAAETFDPKIEFFPLFEDKVLVVMSKQSKHVSKKYMELEDFHGIEIISLIEKSKHYFFYALLQNKQVKPRRYMTISYPEAMVDLISADLGIGILPQWFVKPFMDRKQLSVCELTKKGKILHWSAACLKSRQVPNYQTEFVKIVRSEAIA